MRHEYFHMTDHERKPIVFTVDFDDTLVEKMGMFPDRLKLFSVLSTFASLYIVTAREEIVFENGRMISDDIIKFCKAHDIRIRGIFYNVKDKIKVLTNEIKTMCHFDDDMETVIKCVENNIPVMVPGEMFSSKYMNTCKDVINILNEEEFYTKKLVHLKLSIAKHITDCTFSD